MAVTSNVTPVTDGTKYHCNYCQQDCSGLRISCAECPDFDSCLQCFSSGAEMNNHKKNHSYRFIDNGTFNLIVCDWTADEEMLLLDGIEQHGLANWEDIADHIGTKTDKESQKHFEEIYLSKNIGKATLQVSDTNIPDHSTLDGQLSPTLLKQPGAIDIPQQEQQELGYMMFRDDFEREYENDAESLIKNLICSRDDDELETALKLSMADMYWRVLKERSRWKRVARNYGLITSKHKLIASRRKLGRDDREFKDKIRVFAQLTSNQIWEDLITSRIRERELKHRIKELVRYRRNGITKLSACQEFEESKLLRDKKKETRKRMQVISPPRMTKTSNSKKENDEDKKFIINDYIAKETSEFKENMKRDPCYHYLSDKEKQLCSAMKLKCARYITYKTYILNDYASRRMNIPFKLKPPHFLPQSLKSLLQEFFLQCGWMSE